MKRDNGPFIYTLIIYKLYLSYYLPVKLIKGFGFPDP